MSCQSTTLLVLTDTPTLLESARSSVEDWMSAPGSHTSALSVTC